VPVQVVKWAIYFLSPLKQYPVILISNTVTMLG